MTSKDLFFKLLWRDIKSRIWVAVVVLVVFAIRFPILGLSTIESNLWLLNEKVITQKQLTEEIINWISPNGLVMLALLAVSAALCAFTGFSYLHSRMKLDVYHSIPIKRAKLLAIQYTSGMLIFLIPFLSAHLLYIVICLVRGLFFRAGWDTSFGAYSYPVQYFFIVLSYRNNSNYADRKDTGWTCGACCYWKLLFCRTSDSIGIYAELFYHIL